MNIQKKHIFRFLAIMIILTTFLPIFRYNVPTRFSNPDIYVQMFFVAIIFLETKTLANKPIFWIGVFGIILFIGIPLFWSNRWIWRTTYMNYKWLHNEVVPILTSILLFRQFIISKDYKGLALVIYIAFGSMLITAISSFIVLQLYPIAGRYISEDLVGFYSRRGMAFFYFYVGLAFLTPVFLYYYRTKRISINLTISVMLIFFLAIIKYQITAVLLWFVLFSSIALIIKKEQKLNKLIIQFLVILFLILSLQSIVSVVFREVSILFEGSILERRLYDASLTLENPDIRMESNQHTGRRLARMPLLIRSFFRNPLIGGGVNTGHVYWLDRLSMLGLLGFIPFILIFYYQIKYNLKILDKEYIQYYMLSIIAFVSYGLFKNITGQIIWLVVFFIIPGMNYLKYVKLKIT